MKKVKLKNTVKKVEVFYDGRCGMCCTFMGWLEKQERACDLVSMDYRSEEAQRIFPELLSYHPEKELVVRMIGDDGVEIYQGAEAWVCCMWSSMKHRDLAQKMNGCVLLPIAKKICYFISKNRLGVSRLFFRNKSQLVTENGGEK